jgi:hypothetical protein
VGGVVHGMWTGAEGVALRLSADRVDTLYSVAANGPFTFPATLVEGASYVVEIAANPARHKCTVNAGANGIVPSTGVPSIEVACTGPAVSINLSAPQPWIFDPTVDRQQTLNASMILQTVALTINNSDDQVHSAMVAGAPATIGVPSGPQMLALGLNTIDVELVAQGGLSKTYQIVIERGMAILEQSAYGKASNTRPQSYFGFRLAVSGDTIAVGAYGDSEGAGAVYVFHRTGANWAQQAYLRASNADPGDAFGNAVVLSGDTLAVGAVDERSKATGINGDQSDNSVPGAGAVYIFQRSGGEWHQQAYVKASITPSGGFGYSIALSGDTLVVGAASEVGAYVFQRSGTTWVQQARIDGTTATPKATSEDSFGYAVTISGNTLAVGTPFQDSSSFAGTVYIFGRTGSTWLQQAYLQEPISGINDFFGGAVALVDDTLVVGAYGEDSSATGIGGNQMDNSADNAGAVYIYQRTGSSWILHDYIKASNTDANDIFGISVALSGNVLAVGASDESSNTTGINGVQTNNSATRSGAVYLFRKDGSSWTQQAYVKSSNSEASDLFGSAIALSDDTLVVGAIYEASGATGLNGNQGDNGAPKAGAIYVFR